MTLHFSVSFDFDSRDGLYLCSCRAPHDATRCPDVRYSSPTVLSRYIDLVIGPDFIFNIEICM